MYNPQTARSGKNTSQQVISQALCLSGPICFHPHANLPWGPHGFPCVPNQCRYSGTPNASRWEQQLERLAGKISFLVAVAWGNVNIPRGKAREKAREEQEPGRRWQLYHEDRSEMLKWRGEAAASVFRMCRDPTNKPTMEPSVYLSFPKLHSPAFKPVFNGRTWGILPPLDTFSALTFQGWEGWSQHNTQQAGQPQTGCAHCLNNWNPASAYSQECNSNLDCAIKSSTRENSQFSEEW